MIALSISVTGCVKPSSEKEQNRMTVSVQESEQTDVKQEEVVKQEESAQSSEEAFVQPQPPTKEAVLAMREKVLSGMSEEAVARLRENIKVANQTMERAYLEDVLFEKLSDPENLYWNYFTQKEWIQIGFSVPVDVKYDSSLGMTYEEFKEAYGEPLMEYNRFDVDNFVALMEEMRDSLQSELLKGDLNACIENAQLARETREVQYVVELYHILHDMDYFLLRYGIEDVGKYTKDDSLVSTYYGALQVYPALP